MKRLLILLLVALMLAGCAQAEPKKQEAVYLNITAQEAKEIMDSREGYVILDVRTQEEYDQGHIPGAILIPDYGIEERAEKELTDKDQLILVYCRSGRVAPRCRWQMKRGISVCSGRQETSLGCQAKFLPGTTNGPPQQAGIGNSRKAGLYQHPGIRRHHRLAL